MALTDPRKDVRILRGDSAHDDYVLRTVGGAAVWLPGGVPRGGSAGQVLAKGSSTDWDTLWSTPASGGGGGGALRLGAKLSSDFSSSTSDSDVAITGLSISFTPSVNGMLSLYGRFHASKSVSGRFAYWVIIAGTLASGDATAGWQDSNTAESGTGGFTSGIRRSGVVTNVVGMTGGVTYTISAHFLQGGGGSATFYASSGLGAGSAMNAIGGLFVPS